MSQVQQKLIQGTIGRGAVLALVVTGSWLAQAQLRAADVRYRILNLQSSAPAEVNGSQGRAINRDGDVAGGYWLPGDVGARPFVWFIREVPVWSYEG
jgi:hypothetical protein